jgi:hypothetical protein
MSRRHVSNTNTLVSVTNYLETSKATTVAKIQGGAQSSRVKVGEYPRVAHKVGK